MTTEATENSSDKDETDGDDEAIQNNANEIGEASNNLSHASLPQASPSIKTVDASSMTSTGRSRVQMELDILRNKNLAKTHKDKFKGSSVALSAEETLAFLQAQKQKQKQNITLLPSETRNSKSSGDAILGSWYHQQRALISSEKRKKSEAEAILRGYRAAHHEKEKVEKIEREWKKSNKYLGDVDAKSKIYQVSSSSDLSDLGNSNPRRGAKDANDRTAQPADDKIERDLQTESTQEVEIDALSSSETIAEDKELSPDIDSELPPEKEDNESNKDALLEEATKLVENDEDMSKSQKAETTDSSPNIEMNDETVSTFEESPPIVDTEQTEREGTAGEVEEEKKIEAEEHDLDITNEVIEKVLDQKSDDEASGNQESDEHESVQEEDKLKAEIMEEEVVSDGKVEATSEESLNENEEVEDIIEEESIEEDDADKVETIVPKNDETEVEESKKIDLEKDAAPKDILEMMEVESEDYAESERGIFEMNDTSWRNYISQEEGALFPPEKDRYHLYVSLACPWAHRAMIVRALKGLEDFISYTSVYPIWKQTRPNEEGDEHRGWVFIKSMESSTDEEEAGKHNKVESSSFPAIFDGNEPDVINQCSSIRELYEKADDVWGKYSVPILWDKKRGTIVNNDSSDIIRILNTEFNEFALYPDVDLCPESKIAVIDDLNAWIYPTLNNGVYQCGLATTQEAYMEAVKQATNAFDQLETILKKQRFLAGDHITEADVRLFPTLLRFDEVYNVYFKVNSRMVEKSETLLNYCRDISQIPGVLETCDMQQIKYHYFCSHKELNRFSIVPIGTGFMKLLDKPHNREKIAKVDLNDLKKTKSSTLFRNFFSIIS